MGVLDIDLFVTRLACRDAADLERLQARQLVSAGAGGFDLDDVDPDEGDWPADLESELARATVDELRAVHIAVEVYYGRAIRDAEGSSVQDYWLRQAYRRIINVLMRFMPDMGYSPLELSFVLRVLERMDAGPSARILEVGCGSGSLLYALAENGYGQLQGIDFAPAAVASARARMSGRHPDVRIDNCTIQDLLADGHGGGYDLVMICDVLEHIPVSTVSDFLDHLNRLLAPGGSLLVVTPNRLSGPHDITREILPLGAEPTGLHLREYTLAQLQRLLRGSGFANLSGASWTAAGPDSAAVGVSEAGVRLKLALEPVLRLLPFAVRAPAIERMYFKAVAARKVCEPQAATRSGQA